MRKFAIVPTVFVAVVLGCSSEEKSTEYKDKAVLYADARLDIREDANHLVLLIDNILETLPHLSEEKTVPEEEKLKYNLALIKTFLLKEHKDINKTFKSVQYLEYYINKYHPDFLTIHNLNKIKSVIFMISRWPTYS